MKITSILIASVAAVALASVGASPAYAAARTVDAGDSVYALGEAPLSVYDLQLYGVDSTTAASAPIGPVIGSNVYARQPAWDPLTGDSYYVQLRYADPVTTTLATIDVSSGASTEVGKFWTGLSDARTYLEVVSMAIGDDGTAYAIDSNDDLYTLNLGSAELTDPHALVGTLAPGAFAYDGVTDKFYASNPTTGDVVSIDVTTGITTVVGAWAIYVDSLQFDEAGTAWVIIGGGNHGLWSFTLDNPDASDEYSGQITNSALDKIIPTSALLIVPKSTPAPVVPVVPVAVKPVLADTGADASAPLFVGGTLLLAGAVLLTARRRRTA